MISEFHSNNPVDGKNNDLFIRHLIVELLNFLWDL